MEHTEPTQPTTGRTPCWTQWWKVRTITLMLSLTWVTTLTLCQISVTPRTWWTATSWPGLTPTCRIGKTNFFKSLSAHISSCIWWLFIIILFFFYQFLRIEAALWLACIVWSSIMIALQSVKGEAEPVFGSAWHMKTTMVATGTLKHVEIWREMRLKVPDMETQWRSKSRLAFRTNAHEVNLEFETLVLAWPVLPIYFSFLFIFYSEHFNFVLFVLFILSWYWPSLPSH